MALPRGCSFYSLLHSKLDSITLQKKLNEVYEMIPSLKKKRDQNVNTLSGGERKFVNFGMAIINRPKLLFFDEPLAGLDNKKIAKAISLLSLLHKRGTTLFIIEHRIKSLMPYVTQVIGLKLGRRNIKELVTLDDIKTFLL